MKKYPLLLFLSILSFSGISQEMNNNMFLKKNSIQLELGGHGLIYSINYERILLNAEKFKLAAQAGIAYYPSFIGFRDIWMPIGLNEIFSFNNNHLEIGLGIIPIYESSRDIENMPTGWFWSALLSGRIGYRYQKPDSKFLFRASFTPVIESSLVDKRFVPRKVIAEFYPLGSVTFGYAF